MARANRHNETFKTSELHELIPYACHYSAETIITKNAELVQFIRLRNGGGLRDDDFRNALRQAILESVDPTKIAVWVHTVRSPKKITKIDSKSFSKNIDSLWRMSLPEELRFENDIYITFLIDFSNFSLLKPNNYFRSLTSWLEERRFNKFFEMRNHELTDLVDKLIENLSAFGARRLQIVDRNGTYYSEPMEFIHKITTLQDEEVPIPLGDLSKNLYSERFTFNLYSGRITMYADDDVYYGTVLSLKQLNQVSANAVKDLLNTSYDLVISEAIDFSFGNKNLPQYKYQKYVNSMADDKRLSEAMGGKNYDPQAEDFALRQINISIMRKGIKEFETAMKDLELKLNDLGIVAIEEDLRLEHSFWSTLPGNFAFLKRQDTIHKRDIAIFASYGVDKFSAKDGCMFGEPVTFFETQDIHAYPMHFMNNGQGNILITSYDQEQSQLLANLITTEAADLGANILFYDEFAKYENFARQLGADYTQTLDFEDLKQKMNNKSLILINSLKLILENDGLEYLFNFLDFAAEQDAVVIACANYGDNCEALLPNFGTQVFFQGEIEGVADNFDLFEDEIRIIDLLDGNNFYLKHGLDELLINFRPTAQLTTALLEGIIE